MPQRNGDALATILNALDPDNKLRAHLADLGRVQDEFNRLQGVEDKTIPAQVVVQVVNTQTGSLVTGTTATPWDDTIPQNTEGAELLTLAITPKVSSNTLIIDAVLIVSNGTGAEPITVALFQDSTAGALAAVVAQSINSITQHVVVLRHKMLAGTTVPTTFKIRAGTPSGYTVSLNGSAGARKLGGVSASSITITETVI